MSFLDSLETLRQRPEKERKRIALVWTVSLMFLVVLFWVLSFKMVSLPGSQTERTSPGVLEQAFSGIFSEIKTGAHVIGNQVDSFKNIGTVETK